MFNFSASYIGGGLTRLHAFASWFNKQGGSNFLIHPNSLDIKHLYPANRYLVVEISRIKRLFGDLKYLKDIRRKWGDPDFFYSYGIPIMQRVGRFNWLHINNILPLSKKLIPLTLLDRLKRILLGPQLLRSASWVDVISVESVYSMSVLGSAFSGKILVSENGSDEQISAIRAKLQNPTQPVAVIVGTWGYKKIEDAIKVFESLRKDEPNLRLHIFGPSNFLPIKALNRPDILIEGNVPRKRILQIMSTARYYISTTVLENSYLAASEGVFLAKSSIVSDIGPHRELLEKEEYKRIAYPGIKTKMLVVERDKLSGKNLCSWDNVVKRTLSKMQNTINRI